jgi:type III secretion system FlhB-like substrate exporter
MADTAAEDPVEVEADTEDAEITEIVKVEVGTVADEMVEDTVEDRAVMEETEEAVEVVEEMAVDVTIAEKMVTSPEIAQLLPKADHATNAIKPAISAGTAPPSPRLRFLL